jgi:hypothetical protein
MQTKLTVGLVRRHTEDEAPTRDASFFDVQVPRLALRVKPPRRPGAPWASLYFVRYTSPDGAERRIKVGDPKTMALDAARVAAKAMLAKVDSGGDPVADKAKMRADCTVAEAWTAYEASAEYGNHTPRSRIENTATANPTTSCDSSRRCWRSISVGWGGGTAAAWRT